ncbi:T9SS type A sorting domain-containing protein [Rubricoccus marinus]|uniref:Secretion system C-terminal sorting domain-containing protein n=1 Tax=Rubricoccus marinus TaxID=716817 RepID=A0A259U096_9BACT|nr:T9SS type A sorting domain-containing protein [Rubricoccus marinus]OZC03370.1 hypothetical protein BSZ36_10495 [Rubricoccus marinus]
MTLDTPFARIALLFAFLCLAPASGAQDQPAMFYSGEFNGFTAAPMTYLGPGPDNWVVTLAAPATDAESNFLFRNSSENFNEKWSRGDAVAFDALTTWFDQGGDGRIAVTAGNSYTFVMQDVGNTENSSGIVIETSGPLAAVAGVSRAPAAPQGSQRPVITATLSAPLPTGQGVYLRSTADAFASSTVTEMACAAQTCTAEIPASGVGATVVYYVFSSADGLLISGAQADRFTANLNNNGGANYSYTVAASTATVSGADGYRMFAAPEAGFTVGDLQAFSLVQGIPSSSPDEADNVYTWNGAAYEGAASAADALPSGEGFFWFLRDTNRGGSTPFPVTLTSSGAAPTGDVQVSFSSTDFLAGNPFQGDFRLNSLQLAGGALQNDVSIWDPNGAGMSNGNAGTYVTRSRSSDATVAAWQGFWVEASFAPTALKSGGFSLTYPVSGVTSGAVFVGKTSAPVSRLRFLLNGDGVADHATSLVVSPEADLGYDAYDLGKRTPLAERYVALAFEGSEFLQATASVPSGAESAIALPLALDAVGYSGSLTLTWTREEADLPEGWAYLLRDHVTGETIDLLATDRYTFSVSAAKSARSREEILTQSGALTDGEIRFTLVAGPANVVATEGAAAPEADALTAAYPNPTSGAVRIGLDLASGGDATLVVFDLLGREVAREALGVRPAGPQNVTLETAAWATGTYLVRLDVDGEPRATRRLVRVR